MTKHTCLQIKLVAIICLVPVTSLPLFAQQLQPEENYLQGKSGPPPSAPESKPSSNQVRKLVVDRPDAPNGCKLVDIPDERLEVDKANKQISEMEQKLFNREFSLKTMDDRLVNLELKLFGMGRLGSYSSRINSLSSTIIGAAPTVKTPDHELSSDEQDLAQLEKRFFEQEDFSLQPPEERVMRLEASILGKAKDGDIHTRLLSLKEEMKNRDETAVKAARPAKDTRDSEKKGAISPRPIESENKVSDSYVEMYSGRRQKPRLVNIHPTDKTPLAPKSSSPAASTDSQDIPLMFNEKGQVINSK